ncbi:GNAT family N-acetyltransferase [Oscillatoria sp. CS-180]|uniref:GNAT family N-acetyltransferase n=1 Tax=Oscillatoria sp. CS-180 TaxID=3021720 RepID=UPI00232D505A|nr:GNAT family N-acetyltransferase [Oscillatoria sp. CS-180]MDB9524888.1 GNAT family N-acetyltransferase [Oscillatoria sp. CS-180]
MQAEDKITPGEFDISDDAQLYGHSYIRKATPTDRDIDLLVALSKGTFMGAYADDNDPINLARYIKSAFSREAIADKLSAPESTFLIAHEGSSPDTTPIGYAQLIAGSPVPCHEAAQTPIELSRLYVEQSHIGQGYGSKLMQACLDYAVSNGCETIWLGVWEHNERAQAFYQRWKFQPVGTHIFVLGDEAQTDHVLVRHLAPNGK